MLDKRFLPSLMQQITISSVAQDKSLKWTEEAKREHIYENANINVPHQNKDKYKKLILKHFIIVSTGKNDLEEKKISSTRYT